MNFIEFLENNIVVLDGGMGTILQERGLKPGDYPERWNITHSDTIIYIHKSYFESGSNVVCTNTFGANCLKFDYAELDEIIKSAVENARNAQSQCEKKHEKYVALDIGPLGKLLKPYGDLNFEDAVECFAKTVRIGVKYGVDLIFIETMNDSYETKAALLAAKENSTLPVLVSNAYGEDGKLMTGASPLAMIAMLEGMGADAIGVNCSLGPKQLGKVIKQYLEYSSVPVIMKPNAGLPKCENGKTFYDVGPEEFSDDLAMQIKNGVRIAGGCCGTTPKYICDLYNKLKDIKPVKQEKKNISAVSSYTHAVIFGGSPVLIGERINPTGKKRFKQALIDNDIDYILGEGVKQQESGAHILDVNVGLPDIDEPSMLKTVVCELQAVSDLPLQIDTSDSAAMEMAMRYYNGKPMINSVNGKKESMETIFPLVKKYGGLVVALTLDENGIPSDSQGRVDIAKRILKTAKSYGIDKKDIIFDTLAMTISADKNAALATLDSLDRISSELGCNTSLGVSNISFGLPARDSINCTFFACALERGLSAAIMNPYSASMMQIYYTYRALHGLDESCLDYIEFSKTVQSGIQLIPGVKTDSEQASKSLLQKAILRGLKENAAASTRELLKSEDPLSIIQNEIIPALDIAGTGFENGTIYLPQLLMSAESAKNAFEEIKKAAKVISGKTKCPIVIATVKGDIHDIGKNIVKLLLENYGFDVKDLGKDVSAEDVLAAVKKYNAPIAALSALMTTTVPAMEDTIKLIHKEASWCKVIVGGAVLNEEYAKKIGADKYSKDAMGAVRHAESIFNEIQINFNERV